jgi:hypothetical protein
VRYRGLCFDRYRIRGNGVSAANDRPSLITGGYARQRLASTYAVKLMAGGNRIFHQRPYIGYYW